ncbi:MAG: peroxidase [Spirochaetae bacterium HGW-Spirochaetae-7]|jgi:uncharacterized peroxidase-related enzyme|nr:MAG: peroxidase [Spirochaetae bacterium HGW-Spirochaetae-7]
MAFIKVIEPEQATGLLKEIYDGLVQSRGKVADVHKIQSLHPETITAHMDLYMSVMFSASPLSRAEREMMAVVVSMQNGCPYCQEHHGQALNHYWKDEARLSRLRTDPATAGLSTREAALCTFAKLVTTAPAVGADGSAVAELKKAGLDDRGILDATLVIGYFNFVNRIVLTLGVELENNPGGYKY